MVYPGRHSYNIASTIRLAVFGELVSFAQILTPRTKGMSRIVNTGSRGEGRAGRHSSAAGKSSLMVQRTNQPFGCLGSVSLVAYPGPFIFYFCLSSVCLPPRAALLRESKLPDRRIVSSLLRLLVLLILLLFVRNLPPTSPQL